MLLDRGQLVAFAPHDEMTSTNDTYRTLFNLAIHEDDETDTARTPTQPDPSAEDPPVFEN